MLKLLIKRIKKKNQEWRKLGKSKTKLLRFQKGSSNFQYKTSYKQIKFENVEFKKKKRVLAEINI